MCSFQTGNNIKDSIIQLGTIFNWEKEYFTMDEVITKHSCEYAGRE